MMLYRRTQSLTEVAQHEQRHERQRRRLQSYSISEEDNGGDNGDGVFPFVPALSMSASNPVKERLCKSASCHIGFGLVILMLPCYLTTGGGIPSIISCCMNAFKCDLITFNPKVQYVYKFIITFADSSSGLTSMIICNAPKCAVFNPKEIKPFKPLFPNFPVKSLKKSRFICLKC